ncbi:MAG: type II toxin-antitoxin system VapC family toxin [Betaproteobacteria bacterium]
MRLLLDTHALLWWVDGGGSLSPAQLRAIGRPANQVCVSVASAWEMSIKASLGKLELAASVGEYIARHLAANRFQLLEIGLAHAARVEQLPYHHRDPFDRLLAAQALEEGLVLVSRDAVFARYGVKRIA